MRIIYTILGLLFSITLIAQQDVDVPTKDQVTQDDLIVVGSLAVGMDAVNGENFGFNTIVLKENNLRIKFWDTSNSASFPSNDWELQANESANGGLNHFSIFDASANRRVFTVEAGARANSLYIDNGGRLGLGTANPVTEIHSSDGDTPTLRLEQNGSSGWSPQTWDVAGNETNFFIRDATNGSKLPFRIRPGAPTNTLYLDADGDIGIGTASPEWDVEVAGNGIKMLQVTSNDGGPVQYRIKSDSDNRRFVAVDNSNVQQGQIYFKGLNQIQFLGENINTSLLYLDNGDVGIGTTTPQSKLAVNGTITAKEVEVTLAGWPDYVFTDDYQLKSLSEVESFINENNHLPGVPSEQEVVEEGINLGEMNAILLEKIEELTLYMIDLKKENEEIKSQIRELEK